MKALASISLALCFFLSLSQSALAQDRLILNDGSTLEVKIIEQNDDIVRFYLLEDDAKRHISLEKKYIDRIERKAKNLRIVNLSLYSEPHKLKNVSYEIKDSSILVSNSVTGNFEVFYNNIKSVDVRRKNGGKRAAIGAAIGAATGLLLGYGIGSAVGDDPPCPPPFFSPTQSILVALQQLYAAAFDPCTSRTAEEKAEAGAAFGMIYGALIGAAVGWGRVKIPIKGSFEKFDRNKSKLERYSIKVLSNSHPEEPIQ